MVISGKMYLILDINKNDGWFLTIIWQISFYDIAGLRIANNIMSFIHPYIPHPFISTWLQNQHNTSQPTHIQQKHTPRKRHRERNDTNTVSLHKVESHTRATDATGRDVQKWCENTKCNSNSANNCSIVSLRQDTREECFLLVSESQGQRETEDQTVA